MCPGKFSDWDRVAFEARAREKGWSPLRIQQAWGALQQRQALADADTILAEPAPGHLATPLAGDRVRSLDHNGYAGTMIARDGDLVWVKWDEWRGGPTDQGPYCAPPPVIISIYFLRKFS